MNPSHHAATPLGRRRLLRHLLAMGAAASGLLPGPLGRAAPAWAAAAAPPAPPPPPGSPPDKANVAAVTVSPQDPAIRAEAVEYPGVIGKMLGYLSTPAGGETYPGILVLHDLIGLTEHVRDVTRRLAKIGYVALAPDLLSRLGGTAKVGNQAAVIAAMQSTPTTEYVNEMNASVRNLEAQPLVSKTRIGLLGFGVGGTLGWVLGTVNQDIKAAVLFAMQTPDPTAPLRVTAPVLGLFGEDDKDDTEDLKSFDEAMKKAGATWQYKVEPKAGRTFFDDSRTLYAADAAKDAWKLTTDWFDKYLRG